jgi:hypothetical protein
MKQYLYKVTDPPSQHHEDFVHICADFASKDLGVANFKIQWVVKDPINKLEKMVNHFTSKISDLDDFIWSDHDISGKIALVKRIVYISVTNLPFEGGLCAMHELKHLSDFDKGIISYEADAFGESRARSYEIECAEKMIEHYERKCAI